VSQAREVTVALGGRCCRLVARLAKPSHEWHDSPVTIQVAKARCPGVTPDA
jgi:hypothetical protein